MLHARVCLSLAAVLVICGGLNSAVTAHAGVRRDITALSPSELTAYRDAFRQLQSGPEYARLAGRHGCPEYYCHNDPRIFLPWHRAYVRKLEEALQRIDSSLALHYWDWASPTAISSGIPRAFTDVTYTSGGVAYPNPLRSFHYRCGRRDQDTRRSPGAPFLLRTLAGQVNAAYGLTSYNSFNGNVTSGSRGILTPHNSLHTWVGSEMAVTTWAAYDPLFWAHHSNVDRQWARWQECHGGRPPAAAIQRLPLNPFGMTVAQVLDYRALGYEYDTLGCVRFTFALAGGEPMKIRGFEVRQGVKYLLDVEGLPHHPADSFRVYVFVNQPDATLEQVRPDNPNFAGFFGIFGGEHAPAGEEEIRDQNQRPDPPTEHHIPDDEIQGTPVLDLTSAIAHIAESADNANRVDLTLTILATNVEGQQVETSDLPFTGISIRAEESISRKPSDRGHAAARQNHSVAMRDNRFSPLDITIQVGDTITWLNEGDNVHTATSDDGKFFNTGDVDPGNSSNPITFDEAGEFPYHCRHHGRMRGKVTVVAGGTPRPETP